MPGKLGIKLIPRLSTTKKFHSLRELVFSIFEKSPTIQKEEMEKIIRKEYPKANFFSHEGKGGHFTWYKHKWNKSKLEKEFTLVGNINGIEKDGDIDVEQSHESKEDREGNVKRVGNETVGHVRSRKKNRRVQVHKSKKSVGIKTKQTILKRKRHSASARPTPKT